VEALIGENVRSAAENEFPFIVAIAKYSIEHNSKVRYTCAGSLLSTTDVLTSEHCLMSKEISGIYVYAGSSYLDCTTRHYSLWWLTFDQWAIKNNYEIIHTFNDIAIVKVINFISIF
jgi:secreted trypsin-like serine protease